ncbi:MAG TPA: hypothetical protein VJ204_07560 [Solirubrobacterales bacterium]|nr:hypothetical protein [Solirubrobacterales bacterium]
MSVALEEWRGASARALDEIESLHRLVEERSQSAPALTRQITYAYAALTLAHFQRYCRTLHTEVANALVAGLPDPALARVLGGALIERRFLDRANPTPGNLNQDFGRFGFKLWLDIEADDGMSSTRKKELARLCDWRNAIAHGDISRKRAAGQLVPRDLDLKTCRDWRRSLEALTVSIDRVTARRCQILGCPEPW